MMNSIHPFQFIIHANGWQVVSANVKGPVHAARRVGLCAMLWPVSSA
jgi:hypothetical protein